MDTPQSALAESVAENDETPPGQLTIDYLTLISLLHNTEPNIVPLLLDIRPSDAFAKSHIKTAQLFLQHIEPQSQDDLPAGSYLSSLIGFVSEANKRFDLTSSRRPKWIIYDESDLHDRDLMILIHRMAARAIDVSLLIGGFAGFSRAHPHFCTGKVPPVPRFTCSIERANSLPHHRPTSAHDALNAPASEILPDLYMSGEREAHDPVFVQQYGITHVLCLTSAPFDPEVAKIAKCLRIVMDDSICQDMLQYLPQAFEFIDEARHGNGKVLVHCYAGVSRSAAITIAYCMRTFHWSLQQAYDIVQKQRPCIAPNISFMGQLERLDTHFRPKSASGNPV